MPNYDNVINGDYQYSVIRNDQFRLELALFELEADACAFADLKNKNWNPKADVVAPWYSVRKLDG